MSKQHTFSVIIAAGGQGIRFNATARKQYITILGYPLLVWTLYAFSQSLCGKKIIVVVPEADVIGLKEELFRDYSFQDSVRIISGGISRQESVFNGLLYLNEETEWVVIHDGVRPAVTPALINTVCQEAIDNGAALAAIPAIDSTFIESEMTIEQYINRSHLWQAQTPQVFRLKDILSAHKKAQEEHFYAPDDGIIYRRYIGDVKVVMGDINNIKVTYPQDLIALEAVLHTRGEKPR
jgi:2-C-methyl-D-erythritol 4-phosphate cytidylyltransferase